MIERVRANQTGIQNRNFKKAHVLEAIQDPQVWLYILIQIMSVLSPFIRSLGVFFADLFDKQYSDPHRWTWVLLNYFDQEFRIYGATN